MKRALKGGLIILITAGFIGFGIGVYMYNKPHENIEKSKADYTLIAEELAQEFTGNEMEANAKYLGNILEVSGSVAAINTGRDGSVSVSLFHMLNGVTCTINPEDVVVFEEQLAKIKEGSEVRMKGRCDGLLSDVRISDCVLLD